METLLQHKELLAGALLGAAPFLSPVVNRAVLKVFGNKYVKKGLAIAKALEDGVQVSEVKSLLD